VRVRCVESEAGPVKSRLVPLSVTAAFLLPVLLAWWLNFGPWPWRPEAAGNRGTLIQPPVLVESAGVRSLVHPGLGYEGLASEPFQGHWSLVYAGASDCPNACEAALVNMRQSWLALGKDARRVRRWFLVNDAKSPASSLLEEHPGLTVIALTSASSGTLGAALAVARETAGGANAGEWVWLLDPRGFVILSYGSSATATDILRDMQRLLKYSAQDN